MKPGWNRRQEKPSLSRHQTTISRNPTI